jgi:hypothetical protein
MKKHCVFWWIRFLSDGPLRRLVLPAIVLSFGTLGASPAPGGTVVPRGQHQDAREASIAELSYRVVLDHLVVVPVHFGDRGPFDMVLDTGAIFTTIDSGLAAELNIEPLGSIPVVSAAGSHQASRGRVDRVRIGPVVVSQVDVVWSHMDFVQSAGPSVRGILGQSALSKVSFGLDYRRRRVLFEAPKRSDAVVPLVYREGRPALPFEPRDSQGDLSLVLDSAAPLPMLFEKPGTSLPGAERHVDYFEAKTVSGIATLDMVELDGRVGRLRLPSTPAAVQDDTAAGGREEDGLLPTRLFRLVYFDITEQQVLLRR